MTAPRPTKATCPHFYRYSSCEHLEWLKAVILEHTLYLPTLPELNDPADGRPKITALSEDKMISFLLDAHTKEHPHLSSDALEKQGQKYRQTIRQQGLEELQRLLSQILHKRLEKFRVYSLSKRYDNLSLWAKYAANHTGYCVEFANEGPLFVNAKEVTYDDSIEMDPTNQEDRKGDFLFCKRKEWSNEEEIRLVDAPPNTPTVRIDPRWLTRIILGYCMAEPNRNLIREWAGQRDPELVVATASYDEMEQTITLNL